VITRVAWWPTFCGEQVAVETGRYGDKAQWIYLLDDRTGDAVEWNPPGNSFELGVPRCSPDGKYLAYSSLSDSKWFFNVADLTTGMMASSSPPLGEMIALGYASWSNRLSFVTTGVFSDRNEIRYNQSITSANNKIINGKYPALSPGGNLIAFVCQSRGESAFMICIKVRQPLFIR
jgi:hypothetical protein